MRTFQNGDEYRSYADAEWRSFHLEAGRRARRWFLWFNVLLVITCWMAAITIQGAGALRLSAGHTMYRPGFVRPLEYWRRRHPSEFSTIGAYVIRQTRIGAVDVIHSPRKANGRCDVLQFVEVGWPLPILMGCRWIEDVQIHGDDGSLRVFRPRVIPIVPRPAGYVLAALYAYLLPLLVVHLQRASVLSRRLRIARTRIRKNTCPVCNYDLRGNRDAGCPECGWGRELKDARESPKIALERQ